MGRWFGSLIRMRDRRTGRFALVIVGVLLLGLFVFGAVDVGTADPRPAEPATALPTTTRNPPTTVPPSPIEAAPSDVPASIAPSDAETPEPVRRALTVHAVGDVVFDPDYIVDFRTIGYGAAFDGLDGLFKTDDLTIVNLECSPSMLGAPLDKQFVFRCPPSALAAARAEGVEVANLANNHSQDFGQLAMLDGLLHAHLAGLRPVGVGIDVHSATTPQIIDVGGWRIAVLGMGGVVPGEAWLAGEGAPGMASGDDIDQMTTAVRAASENADFVFVTIHWGIEGESEPRDDDRARAQAMIEAGADAVFGHHPHRLGALELIGDVPVFWTLGNFIWPRLSDASATTGVARLEISAEGEITACLLPAFITRNGQPELTGARDCGGAE